MGTSPSAQSAEVIADNVLCVSCGLSLRGVAADASCPQCATPVARSLGARLSNRDAGWLLYQAGTMPLLAVACLMGRGPSAASFLDLLPYGYEGVSPYVCAAAALVQAGAAVWAAWRLDAFDPTATGEEPESFWPRRLKVASVGLAGSLLMMAFFLVTRSGYGQLHPGNPVRPGPLLFGLAFLTATLYFAMRIVHRLALRAGDPSLERHAYAMVWALPGSQLVPYLFLVLSSIGIHNELLRYGRVVTEWIHIIAVAAALFLLGRMYDRLRHLAIGATPAESSAQGS